MLIPLIPHSKNSNPSRREGFVNSLGNLSIPNVLKTISDSLPEIAKKENVSVIVSKWEIRCPGPEVECVDITRQIIDLFHPSDQTLKMIDEYSKQVQEPIPIEKLLNPFQ